MKQCPACAEEILYEAKKCKHCGEYLESLNAQDVVPAAPQKTRNTVRITLVVVGVLAVLAGGVTGAAFLTDNDRDQRAIPQLEEMVKDERADLTRLGIIQGFGADVECISSGLSWWAQVSNYECVITDRNGNIVIYDAESNWETGILRIKLSR